MLDSPFAITAWSFSRLLSVIYFVAFWSLAVQARGLWGSSGILPIQHYAGLATQQLGLSRFLYMPSFFYFSSGNAAIVGLAVFGMACAFLAGLGFAQGWMLLLCFLIYLSYTALGQDFLAFQWDTLLLEVGFLSLFAVPWAIGFHPWAAVEPHWFVRWTFYLVLFKLIFLSGLVKILSGDESWRNFTALTYHYWTQPIPNFIAPFVHALPASIHRLATIATFVVELALPFLIFSPRTRVYAGVGMILLNCLILLTGNFAFFNWLAIFMCLWLVPSTWLDPLGALAAKIQVVSSAPTAVAAPVMALLALMSLYWCTRFILPPFVHSAMRPILRVTSGWSVSNSYGLFAVMTKDRPEIILEGSNDGQTWLEYEFKFKPGDVKRAPPWMAPHQPRLDWQLWFAAMGTFNQSPWLDDFMLRVEQGSPDVLDLLAKNPFPAAPPQYLRARLFRYEFLSPSEIRAGQGWWKRTLIGDFSPVFKRP